MASFFQLSEFAIPVPADWVWLRRGRSPTLLLVELENISLIDDPAENFKVIMKRTYCLSGSAACSAAPPQRGSQIPEK